MAMSINNLAGDGDLVINADACGAAGCRNDRNLRVVITARYGKRVLCPSCERDISRGDD